MLGDKNATSLCSKNISTLMKIIGYFLLFLLILDMYSTKTNENTN